MSNLSQKDPPELSEATTGRSKCQRCREPILKGEQRVGMLTHPSRSLRTVRAGYATSLLRTVRTFGAGQLVRHGLTVYRVPWHNRRVGMVGRSSGISVRKWMLALPRPHTRNPNPNPNPCNPNPNPNPSPNPNPNPNQVRKWMHPNCFACNMRVDYAPTGRAKCTLEPEGEFLAKGEPRFLLRLMNE